MTEQSTAAPPPPVVIDVEIGSDHSIEAPAAEPVAEPDDEPDEEPDPPPVVVVSPDPMAVVGDRFLAVEQRLDALEQENVSLRTAVEQRAEVTHAHPVPTELAALAEHLDAIDREEVAPVRVRWWERRIF